MRLRDILHLSLLQMLRGRGQSRLTVLSVAIGIFSVVLIASCGAYAAQAVSTELHGLGIDGLLSPEDIAAQEIISLLKKNASLETYDFSGGNIENIARKAAVGYVLTGRRSGLDELRGFCDEETLSPRKARTRIGFQA